MVEKTDRGKEARQYFIECERQLREHRHYSTSEIVESVELQFIGAKYTADILNYSSPSRLEIIHAVHKCNGIPTMALPVYTEKVRPTFSAKDLLKKNECSISSIEFNKRMIEKGFMVEKERTGSKGKIKKFKSLTEKGLKYGQNDASVHNPRETQAHYFEDTFMELFFKVTI